MKKYDSQSEESIILEKLLTQDIDGAPSSDGEETVSKESLAAWIAENPEMAAYYQKRKERQQASKDSEQDKVIRILIRRMGVMDVRHKEEAEAREKRIAWLEKLVWYGQGAAWIIGIIWALVTFIGPRIWTKEAAQAVFCNQVDSCIEKRRKLLKNSIERYKKNHP